MERGALELDIGRTQLTPGSSCRTRRSCALYVPCWMSQGDEEPRSPAWLQETALSGGMAPRDGARRPGEAGVLQNRGGTEPPAPTTPPGDVPTRAPPPRPGGDASPRVAWGRGLRTASLAGSGKQIQRLGSPALADGRPLRCPRCTPVPVPAAGCYSN